MLVVPWADQTSCQLNLQRQYARNESNEGETSLETELLEASPVMQGTVGLLASDQDPEKVCSSLPLANIFPRSILLP
jgi:hypothetical protein